MERRRTLRSSTRTVTTRLPAERAWAIVASGDAGRHWYTDAAPLVVRGLLDRVLGGPPRHGPPSRPRLERGDRVGFWRVTEVGSGSRRLVLDADVRAPGDVRMTARVRPADGGTRVELTIAFRPAGLLGAAYLLADLPARGAVAELTALHLLTVLRRAERSDRRGADAVSSPSTPDR